MCLFGEKILPVVKLALKNLVFGAQCCVIQLEFAVLLHYAFILVYLAALVGLFLLS